MEVAVHAGGEVAAGDGLQALPEAISPAAVLMAVEASWMRLTMSVSWATVALASSRMRANTPPRTCPSSLSMRT
ncbi:hypothetical protein ACWKWK_19115, partial [Pseudoxanthomonas beigongshangi]